MASKNVLSIDSFTATTLVFVNVDNCTYDISTQTAIKRKRPATATNDEDESNDPWMTGIVTSVDQTSGIILVHCDRKEGSEFSEKVLQTNNFTKWSFYRT